MGRTPDAAHMLAAAPGLLFLALMFARWSATYEGMTPAAWIDKKLIESDRSDLVTATETVAG